LASSQGPQQVYSKIATTKTTGDLHTQLTPGGLPSLFLIGKSTEEEGMERKTDRKTNPTKCTTHTSTYACAHTPTHTHTCLHALHYKSHGKPEWEMGTLEYKTAILI
jgi:hypothetical protein